MIDSIKNRSMLNLPASNTLIRNLGRCGQDRHGSVVVAFCLSLPVIFGASGFAIDYARLLSARSVLIRIADETALLVANADTVAAATNGLSQTAAKIKNEFGIESSEYTISGNWLDGSNYRVALSVNVKTTLVGMIPGMPKTLVAAAASTVNRVAPVYETAPPTLTQLSPEAADYNRIYFYCYSSDPKRQQESDQGRRGVTPIADNASPPSSYDTSKMPTCGSNEAPSYMLRNVRDARGTKSRWDETGRNTYVYYTDVTIDTGTLIQTRNMKGWNLGTNEKIDLKTYPILETILCDTAQLCKSKSEGGVIPNRATNRSPGVASGSCENGKYMYYGWEDRPGGDRDYDDIRLIISCPKQTKVSDKKLRFVE